MPQEKQLGIGAHQDRTKRERIERLRRRLDKVPAVAPVIGGLKGVLNGILDLLEDEA